VICFNTFCLFLFVEFSELETQYSALREQMNSISQEIHSHSEFSSKTTKSITTDAELAVNEVRDNIVY
jgi:hypothetical protein